ncbi:MAG: hypothetical protein HYZ28_04750 [Myxococcales bacterium]|nr:hypothetical protein [Myxococcales bacterium]
MIIKKYGNRRLYDTEESRYVTQDELAEKIRAGHEVRVIEAKSGADLTQATLTQLIIEGREAGKLLPVPLLVQLIRLGDDALAEFLGRYVSAALEMYLQARAGTQAMGLYNPFGLAPFGRMFTEPPAPAPRHGEVDQLRRELDELKRSLRKRRK